MPRKRNNSLKLKTICCVTAALLLGAALYFICTQTGYFLIQNIYLSEERQEKRLEKYAEEFSIFVKENKIKSTSFGEIKDWCREKRYVEIVAYTDGKDAPHSESGTRVKKLYSVDFADKTADIYVTEHSQGMLYNMTVYVSITLAAVFVILSILFFNQRIINRVIRLSYEVKEVYYGNLDKEIRVKGSDELSDLGKDINQMRRSIIMHYQKEQDALNANNELLTSLSHDIRTPLTALIGYSEMMTDPACTDADEIKRYAELCRDKAYRLKNMTDALFRYFLIYGKVDLAVDMQTYEAQTLFEQLLGEYTVNLRQKGFSFNTESSTEGEKLDTDIILLKRVFDNVFSNIEKYADPNKEIYINVIPKDEFVLVSVKNKISLDSDTSESTKIGLKSSEKVMQKIGGDFKAFAESDTFTVELKIPMSVI